MKPKKLYRTFSIEHHTQQYLFKGTSVHVGGAEIHSIFLCVPGTSRFPSLQSCILFLTSRALFYISLKPKEFKLKISKVYNI